MTDVVIEMHFRRKNERQINCAGLKDRLRIRIASAGGESVVAMWDVEHRF